MPVMRTPARLNIASSRMGAGSSSGLHDITPWLAFGLLLAALAGGTVRTQWCWGVVDIANEWQAGAVADGCGGVQAHHNLE
ncbi:hypothetical protein E2562_020300 [Oryza meyeriana var. granulata]|uniref:Uncharacterized protein n=1 Tax=Oryza meyeriana var. granulata TaxID=110450 RepID=A0A6G1DK17_9ORYZ|nr:hypothetical protein E2562_020300 [Oryza meyeriana var. granulata]